MSPTNDDWIAIQKSIKRHEAKVTLKQQIAEKLGNIKALEVKKEGEVGCARIREDVAEKIVRVMVGKQTAIFLDTLGGKLAHVNLTIKWDFDKAYRLEEAIRIVQLFDELGAYFDWCYRQRWSLQGLAAVMEVVAKVLVTNTRYQDAVPPVERKVELDENKMPSSQGLNEETLDRFSKLELY